MPIYRILNEKVSYFNTVSTFTAGVDSYASGNMFESLATTNPEAFNDAKLEAILNSKELVSDFHEYFASILGEDMDRYIAFIKEYADKPTNEFLGTFYKDYNISYYSIIRNDIAYLRKMVPDDQLMMIIFNTYLPDTLSEEGIKRLIRVRLANNQILITGLMRMMEANYDAFNIGLCEAQELTNRLSDKDHNNEAIAHIRNILKDPKVLEGFKDRHGNYDFRPIGGAYLIMRNKLELQGAAPAKYLQNLFKYDCIVYSHGNVSKYERSGPIGSTLTSKSSIVEQLRYVTAAMVNDKQLKKILGKNKALINEINSVHEVMQSMCGRTFINMDNLDRIYDVLRELWSKMIDFTNTIDIAKTEDTEYMYSWIRTIDYYLQPIYDKNNKMQNLKDGRSGRWTIQPVNTLTQKNVTHVIDLLRTLKKEGFHNIMIMSCNPGSVKLPSDIHKDGDFNVTMGLHSVLIENFINDDIGVLNENLVDTLKHGFRNMSESIKRLMDSCRARFTAIRKDVSMTIDKKFKGKKFKPVKTGMIKIDDGNKTTYIEIKCSNPEQLKKAILDSNDSIMRMIDIISDDERRYIDMVSSKYSLEKSIFEHVELI